MEKRVSMNNRERKVFFLTLGLTHTAAESKAIYFYKARRSNSSSIFHSRIFEKFLGTFSRSEGRFFADVGSSSSPPAPPP